ncbi:Transcription factor GRAS [Macleaya cordata]|uniref:Transcription factor GRAS n=1 Tax=Macleaya cordata TaxID=56857 RepID=A0A200QKN7_MACCD|nr:Transcription factor GRAS [Macleaya cordata]
MSLLRSADQSGTSYGYMLKSSSGSSGLSNPLFSSDKQKFKYEPEIYRGESYDLRYFSDSPTEDFPASRVEFLSPSSNPTTTFHPQGASSYKLLAVSSPSITEQNPFNSTFAAMRHPNAYQSHPVVEYLDVQSSDFGMIDYDEDEIRLKLQELERELLNDNDDDDDVLGTDQSMDFDSEWVDSIKNLVLPASPKESSSSDSNISSMSSSKEKHALPTVSSPGLSRTLTPKELLFKCAAAISEGNRDEAAAIISDLRQMVSIQGDPSRRIAAYMVEGLAARMAASGQGLYRALKCKVPPTSDRLSAMQILFEVCPCFKFGFMAANGAIEEAVKDEDRVHIIDFDINQGSQYMTLIQTLASQPGKPPRMRITGVDDPESVQRTVGGLKIIGQRLKEFAGSVGMPFEFRALAAKTSDVTPSMLDCHSDEALIVNFAFQLHHMPDESVSTVNQRDQLLRMVKSLDPKLVTVVEQDVNTNTAPFFPRFVEAYNYYLAVFESLDATMPRESPDRMNVERQCLARDIVNIVACEGEERIERYEVAGKWRARMTMAGFKSCPLSTYVDGAIRVILKQYCDRYKVKQVGGALHFGWENKSLIVASAWR